MIAGEKGGEWKYGSIIVSQIAVCDHISLSFSFCAFDIRLSYCGGGFADSICAQRR